MTEQTTTPATEQNDDAKDAAVNNEANGDAKATEDNTFVIPDNPMDLKFSDEPKSMMLNMGAIELLNTINQIKGYDAQISAQDDQFGDDKLIDYAKTSDDAEITRLFNAYDKVLQRLNEQKAKLMDAVNAKLGDQKLSEDDLNAVKEQRKVAIDAAKTAVQYLNVFSESNKATIPVAYDNLQRFLKVVKIPGTRAAGGTGTKGAGTKGTGPTRPRLYGGYVSVNGKEYESFTDAAKDAKLNTDRKVSIQEIKDTWLKSCNVTAWEDTPLYTDDNPVTAKFEIDGNAIEVKRLPMPAKSE